MLEPSQTNHLWNLPPLDIAIVTNNVQHEFWRGHIVEPQQMGCKLRLAGFGICRFYILSSSLIDLAEPKSHVAQVDSDKYYLDRQPKQD